MSHPPGPNDAYGGPYPPQQQPQSQPQLPPQQQPYGQGYGYGQQPHQQPPFPQQQGYGHGYSAPGYPGHQGYPGYPAGALSPGMPPLAGWWSRVGAALLDFLITGLIPLGLMMTGYAQFLRAVAHSLRSECVDRGTCPAPDIPPGAVVLLVVGGLLSFAAGLWLCYREGTTGQTPGKKIVGIHLLREADGRPIGFGMAFVRRLCHAVDGAACYIGYLWPLWDEKKQTFADKIIHTVVVKNQGPAA